MNVSENICFIYEVKLTKFLDRIKTMRGNSFYPVLLDQFKHLLKEIFNHSKLTEEQLKSPFKEILQQHPDACADVDKSLVKSATGEYVGINLNDYRKMTEICSKLFPELKKLM